MSGFLLNFHYIQNVSTMLSRSFVESEIVFFLGFNFLLATSDSIPLLPRGMGTVPVRHIPQYVEQTGYKAQDQEGWLKYYQPRNSFEVNYVENTNLHTYGGGGSNGVANPIFSQSIMESFTVTIKYTGAINLSDRTIRTETVYSENKYERYPDLRRAVQSETGIWPVENTEGAPCPYCCMDTLPAYSSVEIEEARRPNVLCCYTLAFLCALPTFGASFSCISCCLGDQYEKTIKERTTKFNVTIANMCIARIVREADELVTTRIGQMQEVQGTDATAVLLAQIMANPELLRRLQCGLTGTPDSSRMT